MILNSCYDQKELQSNFSVIDALKLSRIFFVCTKKIIKNYCCSKQQLPVLKLRTLFETVDAIYSNWHNYLIFLLVKYKNKKKNGILNRSDCESQTSITSVEKEPLSGLLTKESSHPEFNKSGSGNSIFKLKKTNFDQFDKEKEKINYKIKKKKSLRAIIKKKIPDYVKYISVINEKDLSKFNGFL